MCETEFSLDFIILKGKSIIPSSFKRLHVVPARSAAGRSDQRGRSGLDTLKGTR